MAELGGGAAEFEFLLEILAERVLEAEEMQSRRRERVPHLQAC